MSTYPKSFTDGRNYELNFYEGNIVEIRYLDECSINVELMKAFIQIMYDEIGEEPYYSVANFKNAYGAFDEEAKKYIANEPRIEKQRVCEVILSNSLAVRILVKGYLSFYKPKTPTKVITRVTEGTQFMLKHGLSKNLWNTYLETRVTPELP